MYRVKGGYLRMFEVIWRDIPEGICEGILIKKFQRICIEML